MIKYRYISLFLLLHLITATPCLATGKTVYKPTAWSSLCAEKELGYYVAWLPWFLNDGILQENSDSIENIWGLSPIAAIRYGLTVNNRIDERNDIRLATTAAMRYLSDLTNYWNSEEIALMSLINSAALVERVATENNINTLFPSDSAISALLCALPSSKIGYQGKRSLMDIAMTAKQTPILDTLFNQIGIIRVGISAPIRIKTIEDSLQIDDSGWRRYNRHINHGVRWLNEGDTIYIKWANDIETLNLKLLSLYSFEAELHNKAAEEAELARIAAEEARKKALAEAAKTKIHVVKSGDTLSAIAKKYHVSVNEIKRWNNIKSDIIQIGQKIKILPK